MNLIPRIITISLTAALLIVTQGCRRENAERSPTQQPPTIGIIASLSGMASEQGNDWKEGAELALSELKSKGSDLRLIFEDDQTQPAIAARAFSKLATVNKAAVIIGGTWDFLAEATYPLANQLKTPFITPTNPPELLSAENLTNPYIFTNWLSLEAESAATTKLLNKEKIKTIAILESAIPWGTAHADMVQKIAEQMEIKVTARLTFGFDTYPDVLRTLALKISENPPDLIFAPIEYNGIEFLNRELAKLNIKSLLLTAQHLNEAFKLTKNPEHYRSTFAIYPKVFDSEFAHRFQEHHGHAPQTYAPFGYDAVMFAAKAIESGIKLSDPNSKFSYEGVIGLHALPPEKRALTKGAAIIMTTRSGRFQEYQ